jgi:hypothetical protein
LNGSLKSATAALVVSVLVDTKAVSINAALAPNVVSVIVAGIIADDPRSQLRKALAAIIATGG